ncbi:MAG: response regulator [Acidimicrobiales bacterium]|nr:response regulator [Acidimicrobiales bacterium]
MATVLLATDADWIRDEVDAALGAFHTIHRVRAGSAVLAAVQEVEPDLVLLDLQIGKMGGIACCLDLRLEERAGRIPELKIVLLLDRQADLFLAQRAEADGWLVKPLDSLRLRRAATAVLAGESVREGVEDAARG